MGKLIRTAKIIIVASLLIGSVALLVLSLPGSGWKALSVQTGSMKPAINPGDLVLVRSVPISDLQVGDVITYISPTKNNQTVTHRITEVRTTPDGLGRFITKGDANSQVDPIVYQNRIIGTTKFTIPNLGALFDWLKTWPGLIIAIYLPSLVVVAIEMRKLIRHYRSLEPYIASGFDPDQPHKNHTKAKPKLVAKASAVAMIAAVGIAVPAVHAALSSTATLTNNSISTVTIPPTTDPTYPVISRVTFGNTSTSSSTTNINVTNNNQQTATSGNATGNGATSGNASNTSSTNVNISVNGSSGGSGSGGTPASVTIFNPTGAPIDLSGWALADNAATHAIPNGTVIAPQGSYTFNWPTTNGLDRANGRLVLRNPSAAAIDALSWGSDTSQFNPAIVTNTATTTLARSSPNTDTNSATDWQAL